MHARGQTFSRVASSVPPWSLGDTGGANHTRWLSLREVGALVGASHACGVSRSLSSVSAASTASWSRASALSATSSQSPMSSNCEMDQLALVVTGVVEGLSPWTLPSSLLSPSACASAL